MKSMDKGEAEKSDKDFMQKTIETKLGERQPGCKERETKENARGIPEGN